MLSDFRVVNVVASTQLDATLDLASIYRMLGHAQYEPEIFSGLIYRRENPKATVILFSTGKVVSVGTTSQEEAREAIEVTIKEVGMQGHGLIHVENVVATADIKARIDLEKLVQASSSPRSIVYEPEQFPGLILRREGLVMLIFHTGKVTVVGAKDRRQASTAIRELSSFLRLHECME